MEFSSYCYHSNFRQCVITFINKADTLYKIIVEDMYEEDHMREYKEASFIVTRKELDDFYELYALSMYMTKDARTLVFHNEMWYIETITNWRNNSFTTEYIKSYGFSTPPTEMNILKNNEEIKKYYTPVFNAIINNAKINKVIRDVITTSVIDMIEKDLVKEELHIYTQRRNDIFATKVLCGVLPEDMIRMVSAICNGV